MEPPDGEWRVRSSSALGPAHWYPWPARLTSACGVGPARVLGAAGQLGWELARTAPFEMRHCRRCQVLERKWGATHTW